MSLKEFDSPIEETQSLIIFKMKSKIDELERDLEKAKKDKHSLIGMVVGLFHQFGDTKNMMIRIKKKHMTKAHPAWTLFPEIDHRSKDLIVRFLDPLAVKGGGSCQSTTTNAKDVESNSKCGTSESTTTQKSAQDVEPKRDESTTPNNTSNP